MKKLSNCTNFAPKSVFSNLEMKKGLAKFAKSLIQLLKYLVGPAGVEPTTNGLKVLNHRTFPDDLGLATLNKPLI